MHTRGIGARLICALLLVCLLSGLEGAANPLALAQSGRFYRETGKTLAPEFVQFYDRHGGVLQFGYPVTEARMEGGYVVQWTERQRLEYHPEHRGTPHEVLLGLLGRELTRGLEGPRFRGEAFGTRESGSGEALHFPATGHTVAPQFAPYWTERGGLPIYGYPISQAHKDERGLLVQWFERARMEYHPDNGAHPVLLGHLGLEGMRLSGVRSYEVEVFGAAAPGTPLKVELAQGGESEDPDFLMNVTAQTRSLGPGLLRIDNIYNFYDIVSRAPDGTLRYNWSKFDRALDNIRALGREPMICLSYMPETMSRSGTSRVEPPARLEEWAALVEATVRHVNVERKMGVRYWEVWNEPDQISFWRSGYPDYLQLYDATARAALAADPTVKLGGPSTARFSADHLDEFLYHEAHFSPVGKVDFVSWHEYGRSPDELAANIREARAIIAKYPRLSPEIFITEFNVLQGGPGDTSAYGNTDRVQGAISLLASLESMGRERLDRAFLFELKDGKGPKSYWGRWGVLTNDGQPKPIYHTLKAFSGRPEGMLPVSLRQGPADGKLGIMAFGGPSRSLLFVWYTGEEAARVKLKVPPSFGAAGYTLTLFDEKSNNPARTGDSTLRPWLQRDAGDLAFQVEANSLVIIESR
jgi:hypothetical protein